MEDFEGKVRALREGQEAYRAKEKQLVAEMSDLEERRKSLLYRLSQEASNAVEQELAGVRRRESEKRLELEDCRAVLAVIAEEEKRLFAGRDEQRRAAEVVRLNQVRRELNAGEESFIEDLETFVGRLTGILAALHDARKTLSGQAGELEPLELRFLSGSPVGDLSLAADYLRSALTVIRLKQRKAAKNLKPQPQEGA